MSALISTRPRRASLAVVLMLIASAIIFYLSMGASSDSLQHWSATQVFTRLVGIPALLATAFFALITALGSQSAIAATPKNAVQEVAAASSPSPFLAQVVGLEWLNPLQRRDYPTEWQLLWTLGLVRPNRNDDMVRTKPAAFSSLQSVAGIANGVHGEETFKGFQEKYVDKLTLLLADQYAMNPHYFYTVQPANRREWRELAGIHVEYAIPAGKLNVAETGKYLREQIVDAFNIGNPSFKDLWSKDTAPSVHVTAGGPNAGFTSLNVALEYLQTHPAESVWVMNWDAPSFPPKDAQINENMVLLILAGPTMKTDRTPLAWIGKAASGDIKDFDAKAGTTRTVQAWKATIADAARNANVSATDIQYVIHDAGKGSDYQKQTFNTPALLGEMGAGTALTDVALAIGRANHLGGNVLVAGTTNPEHPTAVVVVPPSKLTPIRADGDWFRARGENNAYLPWWGHRVDTDYKVQGYSY